MLLVKAFFRVIGQVVGGALISLLVIVGFISVIFGGCRVMDAIICVLANIFGDGWTAFTAVVAKSVPFLAGGLVIIVVLLLLGVSVYEEYERLKRKEMYK